MNPTQYLNDIRAITTNAARVGITLPGGLAQQAEHLDELERASRAFQNRTPANYAADIVRHLGNPAALARARAKAAAELAAAEADHRIGAHLVERSAATLRNRMRQNADAILSAFAPAAAEHLAVLNEHAAKLPLGFSEEHASNLSAKDFTTWTRVRDANAALQALHMPLRTLHDTPTNDFLTREAVLSLRYVAPPTFGSDTAEASRFARALAGTAHGGSDIGPVSIQGVFMPTAVAHRGGTFAWANRSEVTARAQAITAAATPRIRRQRGAVMAAS